MANLAFLEILSISPSNLPGILFSLRLLFFSYKYAFIFFFFLCSSFFIYICKLQAFHARIHVLFTKPNYQSFFYLIAELLSPCPPLFFIYQASTLYIDMFTLSNLSFSFSSKHFYIHAFLIFFKIFILQYLFVHIELFVM